MSFTKESKLDAYKQWIISIKPTSDGWEALIFPKGVFYALAMDDLIVLIGKYVMNEVIILVADALNLHYTDITEPKTRERIYGDARMVAGYILYHKFPASQDFVCNVIGWKNHASYIHARKQVDSIVELQEKRDKVYKMYPFLKDSNLEIY